MTPLYANYASWIAALKLWLVADDTADVEVQTWLYLAQLRLNRELQSVPMEATIDIPIDATLAGLPLDIKTLIPNFNKIRLVIPFAYAKPANVVAINEMMALIAAAYQSGPTHAPDIYDPRSYCIDTGKLYIFPYTQENATVTIKYYPIIEPISDTIDSNIFTEFHSDLFLFASLLEGSKFIVEDDRTPMWEKSYLEGIESTNNTQKHQKMGSVPLVRQIKGLS